MRVDSRRADPVVSPRVRRLLLLALVVLVALSVHRLWLAPDPVRIQEFVGETMGTTYSIKVAGGLDADDLSVIRRAIGAELSRVDRLMSNWREDSELSRFNAHASVERFDVSPDLAEVLEISRSVSERSEGAFDVTVAPLVRAWGFGPAEEPLTSPPSSELDALRAHVGWALVEVEEQTLRKRDPAVEVDLSAVAKGWGVDRVSAALAGIGFTDHLVEIGGELRASGRRPDGSIWRVAVERPGSPRREIFEVVELDARGMATSGDYRNYYELDGVRISHAIDPRDGRPIRHRLASVTVIHASAAWADAWATALNVLGPEAGLAVSEREGLAALFITRSADVGFDSRATPAFDSLRVERQN